MTARSLHNFKKCGIFIREETAFAQNKMAGTGLQCQRDHNRPIRVYK